MQSTIFYDVRVTARLSQMLLPFADVLRYWALEAVGKPGSTGWGWGWHRGTGLAAVLPFRQALFRAFRRSESGVVGLDEWQAWPWRAKDGWEVAGVADEARVWVGQIGIAVRGIDNRYD